MAALVVTAQNASSAASSAAEFIQAAQYGAQVAAPNDTVTADANLTPQAAAIENLFKAALLAGLRLFGWFDSGDISATGTSQSLAHGLGAVPSFVIIAPVDSTAVAGVFAITQGAHTSTDVVFTGTSGLKVRVFAFRFP